MKMCLVRVTIFKLAQKDIGNCNIQDCSYFKTVRPFQPKFLTDIFGIMILQMKLKTKFWENRTCTFNWKSNLQPLEAIFELNVVFSLYMHVALLSAFCLPLGVSSFQKNAEFSTLYQILTLQYLQVQHLCYTVVSVCFKKTPHSWWDIEQV